MKKLLRTLIVILLLVVTAAVIYTQMRIYAPLSPHMSPSGEKVANILAQSASPAPAPQQAVKVLDTVPSVSASGIGAFPASTLGTSASPVVVRLAEAPESGQQLAEHEKDREIQRGIEHYTARLAATSLAQNFLMLFQAIIYFLTLVVLFLLLENVRKFADAAARSAEAARKSAELAESLVAKHKDKPQPSGKFPPHFYRKR